MEEDQEEHWVTLEEDYHQEQYTTQPLYKINHIPNSLALNYDLKISKDVFSFVRQCEYKDKITLRIIVANLVSSLKKDRNVLYPRNVAIKIVERKSVV